MNSFYSNYLGPLDKDSCFYFLFLTIIFLIVLIIVFISEIYFILFHYQKLTYQVFTRGLLILCNTFLAYFVNRLLFTMCSKSLS
jgi:hypothetical protein